MMASSHLRAIPLAAYALARQQIGEGSPMYVLVICQPGQNEYPGRLNNMTSFKAPHATNQPLLVQSPNMLDAERQARQ